MGYGDKEIYWITATAAGEPFAFEPFVAGALGDCGAIVHFDPRVSLDMSTLATTTSITSTTTTTTTLAALPFFSNAEYLLDLSKIKAEGDFLDPQPLKPTKPSKDSAGRGSVVPGGVRGPTITMPVPMIEGNTTIYALKDWKNMQHGFYPCGACLHATCVQAPKFVLDEVNKVIESRSY